MRKLPRKFRRYEQSFAPGELAIRSLCLNRRGVAAVEGALSLLLLFGVLFAMFDIGTAALRYNMLSVAARAVSRAAIIHGTLAPPQKTIWGPTAYSGNAGDGSEIAQVAAPYLITLDPSAVTISVTWPDNDTQANDRVTVKVSYLNSPIVPLLSRMGILNLNATSTLRIVH